MRRELTVRGELVDLQPLTFDLLAYFLSNVGRVIGKDELLAKVWRDSVGSDETIAQAVMKVRRAIGDQSPHQQLKTVPRVGYRLDVQPRVLDLPEILPQAQISLESIQRALRPVVLLPCKNLTGDVNFDWAEHGLPALVQQMASTRSRVRVATSPSSWNQSGGLTDDQLVSACAALGAAEAVALDLSRDGRGLRLHARRGSDETSAKRFDIEADDVADLAHRLVSSLQSGSEAVGEADVDRSFWEEQLARALDLERRGANERALALMDECVACLPPSAQLWLTHAAILRKAGRRADAGARARAALALADDVTPAMRARALLEMTMLAWHERQPNEAARLAEEALAAAQMEPAGAALIPDILSYYAGFTREREHPSVGIRLAERAIAAAVALGNRDKESHARVVLGSVLLHAGQTHRAGDVLRRAADLAYRHGLTQTGAYALRTLALLDEQAGRYSVAIEEARRSAALAASCGNYNLRDSARVQEVVSLVHLGQLDDARIAADRIQESVSRAWENAVSLRYGRALLAWRSGEGRDATEEMKLVADETRAAGLRFANVARLEECLQLVALHDLPAASQALADLERAGAEVGAMQARAALRLAEGRRDDCIAALRDAANAAMLDSADSVQIDINLAWLLLENNELDEASALVGTVAESLSEGFSARILGAGHLLATNQQALADGEWETLVSTSPRLSREYPWLMDPDTGEKIRSGKLRTLPELLTRACW
jgi:DNA-binding winged helix-turn-helix (wHTH) protein/tetratricopeptide (TPR) repeat protein